jgi:hypothetical protein
MVLTPELALHSAMAREMNSARPRVVPPVLARRVSCSLMIAMPPSGTTDDINWTCSETVAGSVNKP